MSTEWLDDSKLINTQIDERKLDSDAKIINVDIDNTNTDLKYDESTIIVGNENLTLENVNIKNKYGKGIKIEGKSDVVIEGDVKIETNKTEAISLEGSSNDNKSRLYVNGKLKQVGDTYTIKAKNDGDYTEVYDKSNILSKGLDSGGSGYYNTSLRTGNTPKLPDSSMELTKEVSTDDELVAALENPKVQEIIVLNDIEISKKEIYSMIKIEGEYKKIVGKSSTNKPKISYKFDAYIFFDVKCNKGLDITNIDFNSIRMNSDKVYIENCTIENGIAMTGQSIKNSTVVNCSISAVNIENCKLINAQIDVSRLDSDVKITNVDIDNTMTKLVDYASTIWVSNENLTLKNVNIKNKSGRPLSIQGNSKVIIEGNVTIETNKTEAILLEMDYTKQMARLYVNGDLKQIGDTYTIVSKQSGVYTEVYDKNNILNSSMDKDGTAYYNTINRVGSEPKLPENNKNGWKQENKVWYYYKNGIKSKGWLKDANKWYYLGEDGKMQTGWKMVHGTWYYLNGSGAMETGWKNLNGTWYYLRPSGAMATGWEKVNGTWYYLRSSGSMATGWIDLSGTWYYLDGSGAMKTGWQKISGKWYYMYGSGAMAKNTVIDGWKINSSGVATKIK
ncbi:Choline binding protein J [Romboutsia lituseburensis]|nr:pectate lyase-like adhesive domain-containing protein [Romboutsia lituseburensis]CEH33376.1 Choline binding protein J [Romboutsia lituseburensis]